MPPVVLSVSQVLALRSRGQLLSGPRPRGVAEAVRSVGALQAQSTAAVRMAVRVRTQGATSAEFDVALTAERRIVRTWLMRGTIHLVAAEDVGWMTELVGPTVRASYRRRREQLGLTDELCDGALAALPLVLAGGVPIRLSQVIARLADVGVAIDSTAQAPTHLMMLAATHGVVCRGPEAGREPTFVRTDEWVAPGLRLDRDEALARLARLSLAGRGPSGVRDFATWSGLPAADCRSAFDLLAPDLIEIDAAGTRMVALADLDRTPPPQTPARLLGLWDEYLLSYRTRELILDAGFADRVLVGGVIQSVVLVDGRVAGVWRLHGTGRHRRLVVEPWVTISAATTRAIESEARDAGRFLDADVDIVLAT